MASAFFDVKDYGAVGDGITDDTASVQAAAAAARAASIADGTDYGSRGATVFFPHGQYKLSESLVFDYTRGIRLIGEGTTGNIGSPESATLLFKQSALATANLISARGSANFQIENMDLQYDHPSMLGTLVAVDGTYGEDVEYSTATVNVANGSVAINLTGGAWIPTTPAMRSIVIAGAQKEYRITIMSPTTGVLDTPYQGSTDAAAPYKLLGGNDTGDPVFKNVHFAGASAAVGHAKNLLSLNMAIGALVNKCVFKFAENGIVGPRNGGWGSFTATISDSTFMRISSGAGIRNPGGAWLVESCTFEPAYGYDEGPVGIISTDDGSMSWLLTVNNCWFGDGGGQDLRPWISFNGFILNFTNNFVASAGPNQPLILVQGYGGTIHNVNITGNYLAPDNTAPAIKTGVGTVESMTISGNWWGYGTELISDPGNHVQNLTVIDTGAKTDFRTGFHEYGRKMAKSGVAAEYAFSAQNFTADVGNWTVASGDVTALRYALTGKTLTIWFDIVTTTVSATPSFLAITLPESLSAAFTGYTGQYAYTDNDGSWKIGSSHVTLNGSTLEFYMLGGSNWSVSADLTSLHGVAVIPVN